MAGNDVADRCDRQVEPGRIGLEIGEFVRFNFRVGAFAPILDVGQFDPSPLLPIQCLSTEKGFSPENPLCGNTPEPPFFTTAVYNIKNWSIKYYPS